MINVDNGRAWRLDFLDAFVFPELLILSERMVFVDKYIPREKLGKRRAGSSTPKGVAHGA